MLLVLAWVIFEIINTFTSPEIKGHKKIVHLTLRLILGFLVECGLAYAISVICKKIQTRARRERVVEMLVNQETRVLRRRNSSEDSEIAARTEETSVESEPVLAGEPLEAACDQNRLDAIADTIRTARENMGIRFPANDPHVPESVERY